MANNRIYYAIQQVTLGTSETRERIHGLQSAGITTNFNLQQVFEMGQLAIYQNIEQVPDVEVTLNKVLDGYPLIYTLATEMGTDVDPEAIATSPTIAGRQNARADLELGIFPDNLTQASGTAFSSVMCSGMYVSSVSYTFPVDGNFTEDVTLVGNNKVWGASATGQFTEAVGSEDSPEAISGVGRRQFLDMSACRFPSEIPGIVAGVNPAIGNGSGYAAHFQNISVKCDLGRESINELGTLAPYHRYVTFPVTVTCDFETVAVSGDNINATEHGYYNPDGSVASGEPPSGCGEPRHNLTDALIFLQTCEGTRIQLGGKNKLTSVNYNGGDTGGGNVSVSYSYQTFNEFVVAHSGGSYYASVGASGYSG